jgi:rhodanese-related sulfurtransferase
MAVPRITKEELKLRLDGPLEKRPLVIDVRLKYPYEHSTVTLPGAVRMPPGGLDASRLPRDQDIVLYDSDPEELVSTRVASELIREGYRASALVGGIAEWVNAKLPTDSKPAPQAAAPPTPGALKG